MGDFDVIRSMTPFWFSVKACRMYQVIFSSTNIIVSIGILFIYSIFTLLTSMAREVIQLIVKE